MLIDAAVKFNTLLLCALKIPPTCFIQFKEHQMKQKVACILYLIFKKPVIVVFCYFVCLFVFNVVVAIVGVGVVAASDAAVAVVMCMWKGVG